MTQAWRCAWSRPASDNTENTTQDIGFLHRAHALW